MSATSSSERVSSTRRTLDVLMCFSRERHTLSSRELAAMTGIALPSLYRYVAVLRAAGIMSSDHQGKLHLTARVISMAEAAEAADPLIEVADPFMRDLALATGETVLLSRWVEGAATCVHRIMSSHRLRTHYEPGEPVPLEHGASTRILLGAISKRDRDAALSKVAQEDPTRAQAILDSVERAAERGWAINSDEADDELPAEDNQGIWTAAAAVRDVRGVMSATVAVPIPIIRAPHDRRDGLLEHVIATAEQISQTLADSMDPLH